AKETLTPRGGSTDVASALRQTAAGGGAAAGRKLSGVLVVSDGADNAELAAGLTAEAREAIVGLKVPVNTVAVGAGGLKDLAVERVAVDDFAFVRNTIDVEATIRVKGFGSAQVPVTLKREGQLVATRNVHAEGDGAYKVVFSFAPDQTGHFVYTVETPVYADEAVPTNNSRSFALKVIRDRVRVLMVVGRPSWDERFLRGILKQDPNIDLISFFILRSASDEPKARETELSLIPFPVREIFQEQLRTFDLVIFQNFAHDVRNAYQMSEFLKGMRDYIHDGGAFVMIGGDNSFGEGRYDKTELGAALPVEPVGVPPNVEPFKARLTKEGRQHPVTAVSTSADASAKIWEAMPEVAGAHVLR
ncbi:MAG: theronine dehydrogenase, partial [Myxococcales bacterium]